MVSEGYKYFLHPMLIDPAENFVYRNTSQNVCDPEWSQTFYGSAGFCYRSGFIPS